ENADPQSVPNPIPPTDPDLTQAEAINNGFIGAQQRLLYTDPNAFYGKSGKEALKSTPGILDRLNDLHRETLDLAPTPRIRQHVKSALDNHLAVSREEVLRHVRREARTYQADTAQNRLDLLGTQAALEYNDPNSVAAYAVGAGNAGRAHAHATNGDANTLAGAAASTIWRRAIESALARDDLASANRLRAVAGRALQPTDANAIAGQMATAQEHATGRAFANGQPMPETDPNGPLDLGPALTALDDAHQAATARNDAEWSRDPNQLATNRHFIDTRFGKAKRDAVKAKAELDHAVSTWLDRRDADGNPQTERPPLKTWARLTPDDRRAVDGVLGHHTQSMSLGGAAVEALPDSWPSIGEMAKAIAQAARAQGTRMIGWAARGIAAIVAAEAAAAALLALPLIVLGGRPAGKTTTTIPLGNNARAHVAGDQPNVPIEVREGDRWIRLPVDGAWKWVDGHLIVTIDPDRLRSAVSPETFDEIIRAPGVIDPRALREGKAKEATAPAPRPPLPPPIPWIIEMKLGASTDGGVTTTIHREATREDAEKFCPNYGTYLEIAQRAAATARAMGMASGARLGQKVHRLAELEIRDMATQAELEKRGIRNLEPEIALKSGVTPSYSKGSSRLDVLEIHNDNKTVCVFDFKTGNASMSNEAISRYAKEAGQYANELHKGGYTHVYVIPVHVP
ncbi:MAG TPA: hypothetical protein VMI56_20835, partial [Reyranella sp.]|nr:hypothetical protein [Reyranella sp.]